MNLRANFVVALLISLPVLGADFKDSAKSQVDQFEVRLVPSTLTVLSGQKSKLRFELDVIVKDGYVHDKAPLKLTLAGKGLTFRQSTLSREDLKSREGIGKARKLDFPVEFSATAKGNFELKANLEFYLCTAKVCLKENGEATAHVVVN